jgi:hypothetical protein
MAQDTLKIISCGSSTTNQQIADSIIKQAQKTNFVLVKANAVEMESGYELPVIMPLTNGSWYHFVFIADSASRLLEVRLYDWQEKQVVYQKKYGNVEGTIIQFDFIPRFTEYYMLKPVQINNKKKKLCGQVMLFKKGAHFLNKKPGK